MPAPDWSSLEPQSVLVRLAGDHRNPPVASRGTLYIRSDHVARGEPKAAVVVDFPDMFTAPAHQRTFELDEPALERLLAGRHDGFLEWMIDENLEAETRDKSAVCPGATQPK